MQSISWDWFGSGVNHNRLNSGQWGTLWPAAAPSCWRRQAWHELNAYPEKCHMAKSDLPHTKLHIRVIWLNWFTTNDSVYRVFQIPLLNRLKFETFFLSAISIWTLPQVHCYCEWAQHYLLPADQHCSQWKTQHVSVGSNYFWKHWPWPSLK